MLIVGIPPDPPELNADNLEKYFNMYFRYLFASVNASGDYELLEAIEALEYCPDPTYDASITDDDGQPAKGKVWVPDKSTGDCTDFRIGAGNDSVEEFVNTIIHEANHIRIAHAVREDYNLPPFEKSEKDQDADGIPDRVDENPPPSPPGNPSDGYNSKEDELSATAFADDRSAEDTCE